ncbi:cadherin egf lag seven-pass g-type receptor 2 [Plakobranchus ocellatus]|uniref:Cadherin egf lag seven-pass g-type receptor 2 n=1 Tax=Plakobranchus ocellatus TaxID=259542 RepID=A0AAV3Y535_9GAST|nr:cadherin egf lag seven-pass g-type receptor 2 [Plakobranchus ocellatus]
MGNIRYVLCFCSALYTVCVLVSACSDLGYSDYTIRSGDGDSSTDVQYVMLDNQYEVDCNCGEVSSWSIYAHNTGTISLQIWRPVGGSSYQLIGENVLTVSATGDSTFSISSTDRISVVFGDVVGWFASGTVLVDWDDVPGNGASGNNYITTNAAASSVGDTVSFSTTTRDKFAVYAQVSADSSPTFTNLPTTIATSRQAAGAGVGVFTVAATDSGANSTLTFSLLSASPAGSFALASSTGVVSSTSSSITPATYTLSIRVTDTCGNTQDEDLTIIVTNVAPVLYGLPIVVSISESAVDETLLHLINVTDSDGDTVTCSVGSSPSGPFIEKYADDGAGGVTQGVYLQSNPGLDYQTVNSYTITVTCDDGVDSATDFIYVYVILNNVPTISNLQNSTNIASDTPSNTVVFQVEYNDVEGDQTTFSLACSPSTPCPFVIYSTGKIFLSESLLGTSISAYEIDVTVSDAYTSSGTHRLTIYITDINTTPQLTNLPATIQVKEDTVIGTTVFTLSVYDDDGDSSHSFLTSFSPASGVGFFGLENNSRYLTLTSQLNYATQDASYNMSVEVSDSQVSSSPSWLLIEIVNVNKAPVLLQAQYQINSYEAVAGTVLPNPSYNVQDPDGDILTFAFDPSSNNTQGFAINRTTGLISLTLDYDRDNTDLGSSNRQWLVSISDPEGLSVTATLTVSILDTEDNVPRLSSTSYSGSVYTDATIGQVVVTATVTDADATSLNSAIEYSVSGTNLFNVDGFGNVIVFTSLTSYAETQHIFTLTVKNYGSSSSDAATVSVYIVQAPNSDSYFDKAENVAWVTTVTVVGFLLLLLLGYLVYQALQNYTPVPPTQVAPRDTKLPLSARSRPYSRSTVVTPSDIRAIESQWTAWDRHGWF